jgi:hypothetical protein
VVDELMAAIRVVFAAQTVEEQAIPDIALLERSPGGQVTPYVCVQIGDIREGRGRSFAGPRGHDYILPFKYQIVAPTVAIGRRLYTRGVNGLLGMTFPWAGNISKDRGVGGVFPLTQSDGSIEAYVFPAGYRLPFQFES